MKEVLIIQQKMIGDVLISTVLCEAIKRKFPEVKISYVVNSNAIDVIKNNPFVDTIIEFKPIHKSNKIAFLEFLKKIRTQKYDLLIDAYAKTESNLISLWARSSEKVSFYKWYTSFIYSRSVHRKTMALTTAGNAVENRFRLIMTDSEIKETKISPIIFVDQNETMWAKNFLSTRLISLSKPLIMVSVLGSSKNKSLPPSYMAQLIDKVALKTNGNILFNYMPNQRKEAKEIYEATHKLTQEKIHFNVFGKNLRDFISILSVSTLLVGNEGGAVNMAKALGVPTFTVFSPWVKKEAWNMYEDGIRHVSVHLNDFESEHFKGKDSYKKLKKRSLELYQKLTPERITPLLEKYLDQVLFS